MLAENPSLILKLLKAFCNLVNIYCANQCFLFMFSFDVYGHNHLFHSESLTLKSNMRYITQIRMPAKPLLK